MILLDEYSGCEIDGNYYSNDYLLDMFRLQTQLFKQENVIFSIEECINIWQNYSWDLQASWLDMPLVDEYIIKYIKNSDGFISLLEWSK